MPKRLIQTDKIQSGKNSGILVSGDEKISYSQPFELDDFGPDELITKRAAQTLTPDGSDAVIPVWSALVPTDIDVARRHKIDDTTYLFVSLVDGNISEPTLAGGSPGSDSNWEFVGYYYGDWNSGTNYAQNVLVGNSGIVYKSNISGNIGNNPSGSGQWTLIGTNNSDWEDIYTYNSDSVVTDGGTGIPKATYKSLIADNDAPLPDTETTWELIGISYGNIFEKITFSGSTGLQIIDLKINNRQQLFPNIVARAYNVSDMDKIRIKGFSEKITIVDGLDDSLQLDGIFGDGYILLSN